MRNGTRYAGTTLDKLTDDELEAGRRRHGDLIARLDGRPEDIKRLPAWTKLRTRFADKLPHFEAEQAKRGAR
jgi:hypothetical protein